MSSVLIAKMEAPKLYSSDGIVRAFKEHYDQVYEFDWQKTRFNTSVEEMRRRLMGIAMMYHPDVIFLHIQNPDVLDQNTVEFLSNEIGFVILYTFDVREDIDWMKKLAPYLGLLLFADKDSVTQCKKDGIENVDYMQSSCDYQLYKPVDAKLAEKQGIVFIGNNFVGSNLKYPLAQERYDMVHLMRKTFKDQFTCYGHGWDFESQMLDPEKEVAAYNYAKISITHNNFNREGYTSDRLWRSIGCGAYTISQHYEGLDEDFPNHWLLSWKNFDELKSLCSKMLTSKWYINVGAERQRACALRKHTWSIRISNLKEKIQSHGRTDNRMENRSEPAAK